MAEKAETPTDLTPSPLPCFLEKEIEGRAPRDLPHPEWSTPNIASPRRVLAALPHHTPLVTVAVWPPSVSDQGRRAGSERKTTYSYPPWHLPSVVGSSTSSVSTSREGVPQGHILSSLFFSQQHSLEEPGTRPELQWPLTCSREHTSLPHLPSTRPSTCPHQPPPGPAGISRKTLRTELMICLPSRLAPPPATSPPWLVEISYPIIQGPHLRDTCMNSFFFLPFLLW